MRFTGLWRHWDFVRLWAGQTISLVGSGMGALPFAAIFALGATPGQMALLSAARLAPGLLAGLFAGVWVDRLRRRPILIGADLGRAALLCSIPLAAWLDALRIEQLYLVALGEGTLTICFDVAYHAYLPSLVGREELVEANSKLSASASAAEVSAFSIGGWLVQLFSATTAALLDGLSFLASALFVSRIHAPEPPPAPAAQRESMAREIGEGLGVLLRHPVQRALTGALLARDLSYGIIGAVIVLYGTRTLGFQPGVLGMIFGVGGLSSLLGAVLAGRVTCRLGLGPAIIAGALIYPLTTALVPLAHGAGLTAAALLIASQVFGDIALTVGEIGRTSLRQAITPDRLLGRVNASSQFVGTGVMLFGSLAAGVLARAHAA
jgi:MFS family permease